MHRIVRRHPLTDSKYFNRYTCRNDLMHCMDHKRGARSNFRFRGDVPHIQQREANPWCNTAGAAQHNQPPPRQEKKEPRPGSFAFESMKDLTVPEVIRAKARPSKKKNRLNQPPANRLNQLLGPSNGRNLQAVSTTWKTEKTQILQGRSPLSCLLYTSPSPRD